MENVFFSALLFTVGAIIYNLFAPSIIKENDSLADFLNSKKHHTHIIHYRNALGITKEKLLKWNVDVYQLLNSIDLGKYISGYKALSNSNKSGSAETKIGIYYFTERVLFDKNRRTKESLESHFWMVFNHANQARKLAILLAFIFYCLGILTISIVFIQSIIEVIKWV